MKVTAERSNETKTYTLAVIKTGITHKGNAFSIVEFNGNTGRLSGPNGKIRLQTMNGTRSTTIFTNGTVTE